MSHPKQQWSSKLGSSHAPLSTPSRGLPPSSFLQTFTNGPYVRDVFSIPSSHGFLLFFCPKYVWKICWPRFCECVLRMPGPVLRGPRDSHRSATRDSERRANSVAESLVKDEVELILLICKPSKLYDWERERLQKYSIPLQTYQSWRTFWKDI